MNIPIIRLEIEGMKHQIITALTDAHAQIDEDIRRAVEECCTKENISRVVHEAAMVALDRVMREEFQSFFIYGEGRRAVKVAIAEAMREGLS